jgi:hypothetical protein
VQPDLRHHSLFFPNQDGYTRGRFEARNRSSYRYIIFLHLYSSLVMEFPGAINRHRSAEGRPYTTTTTRTTYVNPSYKLPSSKTQVRSGSQTSSPTPASSTSSFPTVRPQSGPGPSQSQPRDVTINGVVFETSNRSLVRKDSASISSSGRLLAQPSPLVKPSSKPPSSGPPRPRVQSQFSRNKSEVGPRTRAYKPKGPPRNRLKLDNTRRAYQSVY